MRGLLWKDFYLAMAQKKYFCMVLGVMAVLLASGQSANFAIGYTAMVCVIFTATTLNYDEANKGGSFLFTLPFGRREYALEKYVFGFLIGGAGWLIASVGGLISLNLRESVVDMKEYFLSAAGIFAVMLLMLAVMLPLEFKHGVEKGRNILLVLWIGIFGVFFWISRAFPGEGSKLAMRFLEQNPRGITVILMMALLLCFLISFFISMKIMEKKQF